MEQEDHWKALAESRDAVQVALVEWMATETPQTPAAVEEAARRYTTRLADVLGLRASRRYALTLWVYRRATVRLHTLKATLTVAACVDCEGTAFQSRDLIADQAAAGQMHEAAGVAVVAAIEQARAHEEGAKRDEQNEAENQRAWPA